MTPHPLPDDVVAEMLAPLLPAQAADDKAIRKARRQKAKQDAQLRVSRDRANEKKANQRRRRRDQLGDTLWRALLSTERFTQRRAKAAAE